MAHDAFISYSSKDKTIADAVCARLEARGIRCWIAPRDVQPGAPYGEEIIDGIHNSRVMVLVLSANANASPHIPKEVERAVSRGLPIIPLRVEDVTPAKSLDYFISSVHWLDAITPPLEAHLESLATTIRTLLPEGSRKPILHLDAQTAPAGTAQAKPSGISSTAGGAKPKWLLPAIGAAVVVLAAAGWYFLGRSPGSGQALVSPPISVDPDNPQPGINPPAVVPPGNININRNPNPSNPDSKIDPIIGCWRWMNNATVVINADGTMTTGPFTAHWRVANAGHRVYNFTWPEAVDAVTLSASGGTISGGNQYGVSMTATRVSPGADLAGAWRWYNGVIVTILPNGTFAAPGVAGRWENTGPGTYSLTWPSPVDTATMSADHQRISGANQYGFRMSGTKMASCGG
jgi:hypothetical protein